LPTASISRSRHGISGGIALIKSTVESEVSKMLEPARKAVATSEVLAKQFSGQVEEIKKDATKVDAAVKDSNERAEAVRDDEKKLEKELATFRSAAESAMDGINNRMETLRKTIAGLEGQGNKPEILAKLNAPHVTVRLAGSVPADFAAKLSARMSEGGKYAVTIEGGRSFVGNSSLRFFYNGDEATAKEIARITGQALGQLGVQDASIPLVNLSGLPIKPPEGSFEVWLNVSNGQLR
jgi:vacuolar-type H+-ATPase subunit I/STV1